MATVKKLSEKCYVAIAETGGSNIELGAYTKNIDINGGKIPVETDDYNTGQVPKIGRQEGFEIEASDVRVINSAIHALKESATDSNALTSGYAFLNGSKEKRLVITWTNQTGITSATQAITGSSWGRRLVFKDGFLNDNPESWEDFDLKGTFNFFTTAYDETGSGNLKIQKCNINTTGESMSALSAYTVGSFG